MFINFGDNGSLDGQGFSPFGRVVPGMDVVDKLNAEYGEGAPRGRGPDQMRMQTEGNAYLAKDFPQAGLRQESDHREIALRARCGWAVSRCWLADGGGASGAAFAEPTASKGPLNTHCRYPRRRARLLAMAAVQARPCSGMELTVRLSFKRNGEIFGARITYQTPASPTTNARSITARCWRRSARCSPLPLSASLGEAIAGRPLTFHIHDTRQQRKA